VSNTGVGDTVSYEGSTAGVVVTINGGAAVNTGGDAAGDSLFQIENLTGSDHADTLTGDELANVLTGGLGDDTLVGGLGSDTATFALARSAYTITRTGADTATVRDNVSGETDTISGMEFLRFSDRTQSFASAAPFPPTEGDDVLTGTEDPDTIDALGGDDTVNGLGGADTLNGGAGNDTLQGGAGADTLTGGGNTGAGDTASYAGSTTGVTVTVNGGAAANSGGDAAGDILREIENLTGSNLNDALTGDAGINRLDGRDGDDVLTGGAGADILVGGNNTVFGDTASHAASSEGVSVNVNAELFNTGGDAEGDQLRGIENLIGSTHSDFLVGDAGANRLTGGGGSDVLIGRDGNDILDAAGDNVGDTLEGGLGDDVYIVDGGDSVQENQGGGADEVRTSAASYTLGDNVENLTGTGFSQTLTGNALTNRITGGSGNDIFIGTDGADTLIGGLGSDTVNYSTATSAVIAGVHGANSLGQTLSGIENLIGGSADRRATS